MARLGQCGYQKTLLGPTIIAMSRTQVFILQGLTQQQLIPRHAASTSTRTHSTTPPWRSSPLVLLSLPLTTSVLYRYLRRQRLPESILRQQCVPPLDRANQSFRPPAARADRLRALAKCETSRCLQIRREGLDPKKAARCTRLDRFIVVCRRARCSTMAGPYTHAQSMLQDLVDLLVAYCWCRRRRSTHRVIDRIWLRPRYQLMYNPPCLSCVCVTDTIHNRLPT